MKSLSFVLLLCLQSILSARPAAGAEFAVPGTSAQQPQMAVAPNGMLYLVYGAGHTIYCAVSRDNGTSFEPPVGIPAEGMLMLGRHRGPRVAATKNAVTITAIAGKQGGGKDGNLLAWHSKDEGKTWSRPVVVNDVAEAAREGLHGMAAGPGNRILVVWLDLRKDETGNGTKLYGTTSSDGGKTWGQNQRIYASPQGTICQCCHPSVSIDARGRLHVMWRNALEGSRDLYHASSSDGGKTFASVQKLGSGTWLLDACPMDGGDLISSEDGQVESVWRRQEEIFVASAGKEERLGKGRNPVVTHGPAGRYVAWEDAESKQVVLLSPGSSKPVPLGSQGQFVDLSMSSAGKVVAAWEETRGQQKVIRVQVLN